LALVGGKPQYDLTIMDFDRWGMNGAVATLRDLAHDGFNIMHRLPDRPDWIAPFDGRAHHAHWCANVVHPDMRLMAAAPDLLAACQRLLVEVRWEAMRADEVTDQARADIALAVAAIAKATGIAP
jgi:hypothetical protein